MQLMNKLFKIVLIIGLLCVPITVQAFVVGGGPPSIEYIVDASNADQGVIGNGKTIKAYVDAIGTSKNAVIKLNHTSIGNTTSYTLTTSETISSNIVLEIESGAILDGAGTLTLNGLFEPERYQVCGSGTIALSSSSILRYVYPEWWGIDGTADNVQIQKAIDFAESGYIGGWKSSPAVLLDARVYNIIAGMTLQNSGLTIKGHGRSTVLVRENGGTYWTFYVAAADPSTARLFNITIEDMAILATTVAPTGGGHIKVETVEGVILRNMLIQDGFVNLEIKGGFSVHVSDINFYHGACYSGETASTFQILLTKGTHTYPNNCCVYIDRVTCSDDNVRHQYSILIQNGDGIWVTDTHVTAAYHTGLWIEPSTNSQISGLYFTNFYSDTCGQSDHSLGNAVRITGTSGTAAYTDILFTNFISYNGGTRGDEAIRIDPTAACKGVHFKGGTIDQWYTHGIYITGTYLTNFSIQNMDIHDNNLGNSAYYGVYVKNHATDFAIQNNRIGRSGDSPGHSRPIVIADQGTNADYLVVTGNICRGNQADNLINTAIHNVVANNLTY